MFHQVYHTVIGVDVAKNKLDIHNKVSQLHNVIKNSPDEIRRFFAQLLSDEFNALVVTEASGGYENHLVEVLHELDIDCMVVNPLRIRQFAKGCGKLEKTDKIDAEVIAEFGTVVKPRLVEQMPLPVKQLEALVHRRRQILSHLHAEQNRLSRETDEEVKDIVQQAIDFYKQQCKTVDKLIARKIAEGKELAPKSKILRSCPGVGAVTTAVLLAELPELGHLNKGKIAKLVGLAPMADDSGLQVGKRAIVAGRKQVRNTLYMAALVATQKNERFKTFYQNLLKKGKPKKVAIIAVARKLIVTLNTMMKNQQSWSETPARS